MKLSSLQYPLHYNSQWYNLKIPFSRCMCLSHYHCTYSNQVSRFIILPLAALEYQCGYMQSSPLHRLSHELFSPGFREWIALNGNEYRSCQILPDPWKFLKLHILHFISFAIFQVRFNGNMRVWSLTFSGIYFLFEWMRPCTGNRAQRVAPIKIFLPYQQASGRLLDACRTTPPGLKPSGVRNSSLHVYIIHFWEN